MRTPNRKLATPAIFGEDGLLKTRALSRRPIRRLLVGLLFLAMCLLPAGQSAYAAPADTGTDNETDIGNIAPGSPSVLVINQESQSYPEDSDEHGQYVEMLLRHFTPNTTRISESQYTEDQLSGYDDVVVVGNDAETALPSVLLKDLAQTDHPVLWLGYGIDQLPVNMTTTYGFEPGKVSEKGLPTSVEYQGQSYPAEPEDYHQVRVTSPSAQVLATYRGGQTPVPYIVRGGNLWYVDGLLTPSPEGYPDANRDAPQLIFADVLHDFFGTSVTESRRAIIRLEDVSVHVDPDRLIEIVDYLYSQNVPFALGLIPAQRFKDGSIIGLGERPEFVKALRYAQDHGGTIILHGYHHTFGSGEDYEFWDNERNAPLAGESWSMYSEKVEDGIRILRDYGIEPRMWETPHYAGSPLAYQVFSHYFSYAFENRDPVGWLPYPAGPDASGQMLIPENLGYIAPEEGMTVDGQIERANMLKIVRDDWAAGFYHPASVPLSELESLVSGLQQQGYTFADLRDVPTEVRYDYQPDTETRLSTWLTLNLGLNSLRRLAWPLIAVAWIGALTVTEIRRRRYARL